MATNAETLTTVGLVHPASPAEIEATNHAASEYLAREVRPPEFILKPIIPRGRIILLLGNSTQGKTPFVYQLARDIASGNFFLD